MAGPWCLRCPGPSPRSCLLHHVMGIRPGHETLVGESPPVPATPAAPDNTMYTPQWPMEMPYLCPFRCDCPSHRGMQVHPTTTTIATTTITITTTTITVITTTITTTTTIATTPRRPQQVEVPEIDDSIGFMALEQVWRAPGSSGPRGWWERVVTAGCDLDSPPLHISLVVSL